MCDRDSPDPLVRKLFRDFDLCLLRVARTPAELCPGKVIVTYPKYLSRIPVVYDIEAVFTPKAEFCSHDAPYERIEIKEKSSSVAASVVADLSGLLNADADAKALEAALRFKNSSSFQVSLGAATRHDLDEADVNRFVRHATLTEEGQDLRLHGCDLHIVLRTITANQVRIESNSALEAEVSAKVAAAASGAVKVSTEGERTLTMNRRDGEMVIGFRAVRVMGTDNELSLAGLGGPLIVKGGSDAAAIASVTSDVSDFAHGDTVFVALDRAR